ncbi:E3 ubiquitin-protein ligase ZNF598 [Solea senegalensis]|uniref:RING-type E3 ubiquitin transferase n=1 Tax=Solea senegalensis TaxID=28829 RepID=A0AAV6RM36_SOLSE|nr:E3 ubiquitin-protein ligase ZNF598 isoform X2 [Solea senegalensis]KAG7505959.1 E3 ubiquitin-protein ligase ZNF598 [Solea senegalensis]
MNSTHTKETEKHCVLCCQDVDIFAFGKCDHPVCYRCSTKMRVLCEQKYCAVCRVELDKVVFVKKVEAFSSLPYQHFACEKKHNIYFGDERIYAQYRHLLLAECVRCPEPKVFSRFEELEQHMRKQHELFCCKLCSKHLKIFTHERKWYNRKELARHRAHGDPDDTSHRGHPLCKFCDDRYLDNDELLKHLRRDHYFCHFCDADGSQEYYSDYQYLSEHFRESHYLCEEGRCATEQFTHAFRTEIDYKAHKAGAHSKNRAEARQNRHIDLQFTYAPRQQRRNEGMVTGEDYEETRHNRGGRGRPHGGGGQKSWRYSREEEDRQMEAAMRASMAVRRQEERGAVQERNTPKHCNEERMERTELEESRHRTAHIKPTNKPPVRTMKSANPGEEDEFPVLGATAATSGVKLAPAVAPVTRAALKEDDFPSLSTVAVSSPMTPAYSAQPKKTSSFQEEDFPALVSKVRPPKHAAGTKSAWSNNTAKPINHPPPSSRPPPPLSSLSSGPQLLSSSSSSVSRKKKKVGENGKAAATRSPPSSDDDSRGITRPVPTMLDISSLLTVKGGNSKPSVMTSSSSNPTPNTDVSTSKASKKKKQQKNTLPPSASVSSTMTTPVNTVSVVKTAQKENVPEKNCNKPLSSTAAAAALTMGLANGHPEKSPTIGKKAAAVTSRPNTAPHLEQEEEFPALTTKKPPPGFKTSFPLKASAPASSSSAPPPPPGLGLSAPKPPPGFTGIPLNSNSKVVEPAPSVNPPPKISSGGYLVPENFHQRNLDLIQSIKNYLHNDESKFNQFKNYSAQFRQGVISAAQYHRSCKDLLGEDFNRIFNELLVLLPDTGKQQELLTAHGDCKALEKQSGAGGGKKNKNKKSAWQTPTTVANAAAELECQVCPTCRQVLAPKDFNSHKTLHIGEREEFPSLQSISRIIS